MQKITLIAVSKIKTSWVNEAISLYANRINHSCKFEIVEIDASDKQQENEKLTTALEKRRGTIILLDELGKLHTSQTFAAFIGKERDRGNELTFVLGGAYGFSDEMKKKYAQHIALSTMTFPHELCRVIFLEQLYRAETILSGTGYHH